MSQIHLKRIGRIQQFGRDCIGLVIVLFALGGVLPAQETYMQMNQKTADPTLDPHNTVGYQTCLKCHAAETGVWSMTWHQTSIDTLHRLPKSKAIASKLGLKSIKYSDRCVKCHYTPTLNGGEKVIAAAVSCECCHGAGKDWVQTHFPPKTSIGKEAPEQKAVRIARNLNNGMRNRHNTFTMARICMRCHNVADEELVNVGGHNIGGADFEMVSYSQGLMRHRFVSGKGKANAPNTPERLNMIFVSGIIADLEFSLRATANATSSKDFGKQVAKRAAKAALRLKSVNQKAPLHVLKQILAEYSSVQLKANNAVNLKAAAEKIRELGVQFGTEYDGSELAAIQSFVPRPARWVFE